MRISFTCLFFLMIQIACAQDCILVVSSGGGIAGSATVYKISMDGKVLKGKGLGKMNFDEQSKLKKSVARTYYRKAKIAVGKGSVFNHPGNIYYTIAILENGKESKIIWGDLQYPVPDQPKSLYQEITTVLNALTFTANVTK